MNIFQSRLRISSAEDPDLHADARPHSAMVARRNGTWGREAPVTRCPHPRSEKKQPGGQTKLFWEPIAYFAHRLSFGLRYANSSDVKDGRDRVRRKSTDIKSSSLKPCLGKQCTTLVRKCKRASHWSRVGEAFVHTLVRIKMKSCTL